MATNTFLGDGALSNNTTGENNTAIGYNALNANETRSRNTAIGGGALADITNGENNTAVGYNALAVNITGDGNTAIGREALGNNQEGNDNIAIGNASGEHHISGNNNIFIGSQGATNDDNTIRIGNSQVQTKTFIQGIYSIPVIGLPVVIDSNGQLGTSVIIPIGTILRISSTFPAPSGYTLIGTESVHYLDTSGHPQFLTVNLYQKN